MVERENIKTCSTHRTNHRIDTSSYWNEYLTNNLFKLNSQLVIMVFKINIPNKTGKTYKVELETEFFNGKNLGDKIQGKEILPDLEGYEFEISGTSDKSGFTAIKGVPGIGLKKVLLEYGKGMHKRQKFEGKKKRSNPTPGGLRLRKTVRGETISEIITQINLKVLKEGKKPLENIFESKPTEESKKESKPTEEKTEEKKEESKKEETEKEEQSGEKPKEKENGEKHSEKSEKKSEEEKKE